MICVNSKFICTINARKYTRKKENGMVGIYIKNYKNFTGEFVGFEDLKKINVVIGKNNIGKSSLLEILPKLKTANLKKLGDFKFTGKLDEKTIIKNFAENISNPFIGNYRSYGMKFKDIPFEYLISSAPFKIEIKFEGIEFHTTAFEALSNAIEDVVFSQFKRTTFFKVNAERNILPEKSSQTIDLSEDGRGATNLIRKIINNSSFQSSLVQVELLEKLNEIMDPDFNFTNLVCQEVEDDQDPEWEIFLEEEVKGMIPLSNSGSGLKTILIVLINLLILPKIKNISLSNTIFIFEELENNLHPAIQRNLFHFLRGWIVDNHAMMFLTTHSNIPLNMFVKDEEAQIIHVFKEENYVNTKRIFELIDSNSVLDDIGVQASDIMQSNAIIWVEGPSDRVYINKWINLSSKGKLVEGEHYQILFYGGRLLSHLTGNDEELELINLFKANRHSIIVMDSDKKSKHGRINATKKRIKNEFADREGIAWITKGREIENYVANNVLIKYYGKPSIQLNDFDKIEEVLNNVDTKQKLGTFYVRDKVGYSKKFCQLMDKESLNQLDLKIMIEKIVQKICEWN